MSARVLGVGIATLDIINVVAAYPAEDAEVRAATQHRRRGGNATNTLVVLSQLGHRCAWAGTLAAEPDAETILADLARWGIDTGHCRRLTAGKVPTSYVTLSRATGSRTIVHYRDLPEYSAADFSAVDPGAFDWVHFEGRAPAETAAMLARVREAAPGATCSVELEKPRDGLEAVLPLADVLLCGRPLAEAWGHDAPGPFLEAVAGLAPGAEIYCTWGAAGAAVRDRAGALAERPAYPPPRVVDTLGAGDTFNAGVIDARLRGLDAPAALEAASRLAGRKCGRDGLAGLGPEAA